MFFLLAQTDPIMGNEISQNWLLAKFFLATVLVIVLAWGLIRFLLPRFYGMKNGKSHFKVLERFPLEPRKNLYLVQMGKKNIVLASTDHTISKIDEIKEEHL